ncbi:MAG: primosomal protein N' [Leptolyngbya sp. IPPAS B-1204]|nr:primosomal protein N' [Elainella sp. C42_A2020_010]RNJ65689.1 MAG: primosomal protein N' [Leptolyngbya sp. IPPAS B-1204]
MIFAVAESHLIYSDASLPQRWIEVLVDCPGAQGLYTYSVPPDLPVQAGDVLSVPFGVQQVGAIAIRWVDQLPVDLDPSAVRPIADVVSPGFFPPTYWTLLQRVAEYYRTPLMQVIRIALPPGLLARSQRRIRLLTPPNQAPLFHPAAQRILELLQNQKQGDYSWQYLQRQVRHANQGLRELLQQGWVESYLESPTPVRPKQRQMVALTAEMGVGDLSPRQQEVVDVLRRRGGEIGLQELLQTCQVSSSMLKTLAQKGYLLIQSREVLRLEATSVCQPDPPKVLTEAQQQALETLTSVSGFSQLLLHGVTGSGKTEVYLQAIAPLLHQGKSALVLVPEIGLTPQLTDRFRARFGSRVCVYHSALSVGERYDTWRQMLNATPQVVIGTRSAIFAPLANLGLIILDEEHDDSFKQDQPAPCYHARTVAQWRAQLADCPLLLGSATPSLETWLSVKPSLNPPETKGQTCYLSLPERIHAQPPPPIEVVDMREELRQGNRSLFSRSLQQVLQNLKSQSQQGILFIHRRGHSTFVSCRSCGYVMECPYCDVSLTYHQPREGGYESLHCHYCGYRQTHPHACPACGSPYLKYFGSGTQRLIQELNRLLPDLRCIRYDSDTTRTKGAHRALLNRFAQGEADLLVGTQMLTKGIDLPQVTLVGVVAADGLLHLADYRASERAFQTLTQVAGRAGRGEHPGRVVIQTYSPQHPVIEAVARQDYAAFVTTELQHRAALHYPPYGQLLLLRLSGLDAPTVGQAAEQLADFLRQVLANQPDCELLGPTAASVPRVARRYRWQILLKSWSSAPLPLPDLAELRSHCPAGISLTVDVDPLHLL